MKTLKKSLAILLAVVLTFGSAVLMASATAPDVYTEGGCTITLDYDTKTLTISGTGALDNTTGWDAKVDDRTASKKLVVESGITEIKSSVFEDFTYLTSVEFKGTVSIGTSAFDGCTALKTVTGKISEIHEGAFNGCKNLVSINISDVDVISDSAFAGCTSLEEIDLSKVTEIGASAFAGCTSLEAIKVNALGASAFSGCTSLEDVTLSADITEIPAGCFYGCKGLEEISLPKNLTAIGSSAFAACTNLEEIEIPKDVEELGDSAFAGCTGLESVEFADKAEITVIGEEAFFGCTLLAEIEIPASVEEIEDSAFEGCTALAKVNYDEKAECNIISTEKIGKEAFLNCAFTCVTLTSEVEEIGKRAFGYKAKGTKIEGFAIECEDETAGFEYSKDNGFYEEPASALDVLISYGKLAINSIVAIAPSFVNIIKALIASITDLIKNVSAK